MSHKQFVVSAVNPNDNMGGGGCICDPMKQIDCKPPFAVFYGNDMESYLSPHVVVCQACALAVVVALAGEVLESGERGVTFNHEAPSHQLNLANTGTDPWADEQLTIVKGVKSVDDEDIPEV